MYIDYPEYATINGVDYKLDTNFETALKCFEIINDTTIHDYEKVLAIVYLLFDFIPNDDEIELFFEKATIYLQCGKTLEEQEQNEKDMDFIEDRGRINASFMSDYHLDLSKEKIHFWQFVDYIEGLKEDCILNRVREIRTMDIKDIKDEKERKKILEEKKRLELKSNKTKKEFSKKQKDNIDNFYKLAGIERSEINE